MKLDETWTHLEEDMRVGSGAERMQRRIVPGGRRDFFLGLQLPTRRRMLILRAAPASVAGHAPVPETRGLAVRIHVRDPQETIAEMELVLMDPQHHDIFDLLIEDLVDVAEQPEDERIAVGRFLARLTDWQRLLMRALPGGLTREMQQGLWGELWTLQQVVAPAVGFCAAVGAWRGPGANQDFQNANTALEVKTSISHSFDVLRIASERQLDVPAGISLAIIALSLDARHGHGESLPELVASTREMARDAGCLDAFERRLLLCEYRDQDAEMYADLGYAVIARAQYLVSSEFPRIVAGDLKPGVSDVRYSIATAACAPFAIEDARLRALWTAGDVSE